MANNYLQPVNDYFDLNKSDLEDVDDDIFLQNSHRTSHTSVNNTRKSTNPFEQDEVLDEHEKKAQIFAERRRQIEERTLDSTQRSLGLLYETEEVGKATAVELSKQREQLENTSRHLDEINATLRFSQRHLNGLKSIFGSFKNYLSGNRDTQITNSPSGSNISQAQLSKETPSQNSNNNFTRTETLSPTERYDNHPVSRLRGDTIGQEQLALSQDQRNQNPFEVQLEANLNEMCSNLSRMKFLATDLGTEIQSQNELLDNMNYKIEDVDIKMVKQNKEMNKLLGKK